MDKDKEVSEFLRLITGQKDVGLIVAENNNEQEDFVKLVEDSGFKTSESVFDFFTLQKGYLVLEEKIEKDFYDFIVQYPTGQVEIFDRKENKPKVFSPDYEVQASVLITTEDNLEKLRSNSFEVMSLVGPVYIKKPSSS